LVETIEQLGKSIKAEVLYVDVCCSYNLSPELVARLKKALKEARNGSGMTYIGITSYAQPENTPVQVVQNMINNNVSANEAIKDAGYLTPPSQVINANYPAPELRTYSP
jgi:hypothetical protein